MGYYVSNMIGIRMGGVFSDSVDMAEVKKHVAKVVKSLRDSPNNPDILDDPSHCMSQELEAHKGSYVVLAGVFNYWTYDKASELARRLSSEFETEVMIMTWDEEINTVHCNIFFEGKPLEEVQENPVIQAARRVF